MLYVVVVAVVVGFFLLLSVSHLVWFEIHF